MLSPEQRDKAGIAEAVHAEAIGQSLLIVCDTDLEENKVSLALDGKGGFENRTCHKFARTSASRPLAMAVAGCSLGRYSMRRKAKISWPT